MSHGMNCFFYRQSFAANATIIEHLCCSENKEYDFLIFKIESCLLISTSERYYNEIKIEDQTQPFGEHADYSCYKRA